MGMRPGKMSKRNIGEISTTNPPTNYTSNNPEKAVANWASIVENENPQAELKS
jgi:hypothetical protein